MMDGKNAEGNPSALGQPSNCGTLVAYVSRMAASLQEAHGQRLE